MKPLITTGRLSTRMDAAEVEQLLARVAPYVPTAADWRHPDIELEIGMGNGLAMLERAKAAPERLFVGSEMYLNGLQSCLAAMAEQQDAPTNLRLTAEDARELMEAIPDGCLSRILVPFPDPWPKAKHHKRRIVQSALLDAAARTLKDGGELWVVTDWPSYAYHSLAVIFGHPAFVLEGTGHAAADCKPSARLEEQLGPHHLATAPAWWVETKYQDKAKVAGRRPWFIRAVKRALA
ncbi:MAG: tRNA (guanosine(46)-N7)-methyltransferase TrmB [Pseudomonadaceae bacterium]|nr:tRNA (guanosine(46)-N7)-methyltransferase TrmB [Pseudomonadaceae bacterium]